MFSNVLRRVEVQYIEVRRLRVTSLVPPHQNIPLPSHTHRHTHIKNLNILIYNDFQFCIFNLASNPCARNNGDCSHLCLLSTAFGGYTCACPDGLNLRLATNQRTCTSLSSGIYHSACPNESLQYLHTNATYVLTVACL